MEPQTGEHATTDPPIDAPAAPLARVEDALAALARGEIVLLYDDRLDEGSFVMAAEKVTPEAVNFMAIEGCGLVCLPMAPVILDRLGLGLMAPQGAGEAFTVSIDLLDPPTTGISAFDRSACVRRATARDARPEEFRVPGHVFPLRARPGGVLARPGATEAAVDLARLAGLEPAAVLCHVLRDDGATAGLADLERIAATFGLALVSIRDLIGARIRAEAAARRAPAPTVPAAGGKDAPDAGWLGAVMV